MGGRASGAIFISYRRDDTAYPAGWLFDRLADKYGQHLIFKDVDSIALGDDFVDVITRAVGSTDVLLALIGEKWIAVTDEHGRRRLDDPDDFVRIEIEAALTRGIRVIPILVGGTTMPRSDQLPPGLTALARRNALELSPSRFESDTSRLIKVLDKTLADVREETLTGTLKAAETTDEGGITPPRSPDEPDSPMRSPSGSPPSARKSRVLAQPGDRIQADLPPAGSWRERTVGNWRLLAGIAAASFLVLAAIIFLTTQLGGSSSGPDSVTQPPTKPAKPTRLDNDLITASSASVLPDANGRTYGPENTLDRDPRTAWNADDGDFSATLIYAFERPVHVVRLDIINGYAEDSDAFTGNARLRVVTFKTDDRSIRRELKDTDHWQTVSGSFGVTKSLEIEIESVYYGNRPDWNDAALSEIRFWEAKT